MPTVTDRIDAALIAQAGDQLKLIANFGNGVDNIDVAAAARRGISVTNTPNVLTEDTADMTMALILAVPRRLVEGAQRADRRRANGPAGRRPGCSAGGSAGKRLGIVGMGRIGTAVARRAKAFGLSIHYHNRHRVCPPSRTSWRRPTGRASTRCWPAWTSSRSTARSTPATFHLLSARRLALMQPVGLHRQHRARRHHRRGCADRHAAGRQARRRRARRLRARAGDQPASW